MTFFKALTSNDRSPIRTNPWAAFIYYVRSDFHFFDFPPAYIVRVFIWRFFSLRIGWQNFSDPPPSETWHNKLMQPYQPHLFFRIGDSINIYNKKNRLSLVLMILFFKIYDNDNYPWSVIWVIINNYHWWFKNDNNLLASWKNSRKFNAPFVMWFL